MREFAKLHQADPVLAYMNMMLLKAAENMVPVKRTDFQALGVRQQADGRLVFDSATFAAAVKDNPSGTNTAANRIGQEIAQVADRTLSDNSRLNIALKNLNTQAGNLESRQTAQQAMADAAQASAEQAGLRLNSALTASGIASYQKIFSL